MKKEDVELIAESRRIQAHYAYMWALYVQTELPHRLLDKSLEGCDIDDPLLFLETAMKDFVIWEKDVAFNASAHDPANGFDATAARELMRGAHDC